MAAVDSCDIEWAGDGDCDGEEEWRLPPRAAPFSNRVSCNRALGLVAHAVSWVSSIYNYKLQRVLMQIVFNINS